MEVTALIRKEHVKWALEDAGYDPSGEDVSDVMDELEEAELEERMYKAAWEYIQQVAVDILEEE